MNATKSRPWPESPWICTKLVAQCGLTGYVIAANFTTRGQRRFEPGSDRPHNPEVAGNKNGLLLDVARWAKEGWIDEAVAAGYYRKGGTPAKAYAYLKDMVGRYCNVWTYEWVPYTTEQFKAGVQRAKRLGAKQILYWESDYFGCEDKKASDKDRTANMAEYSLIPKR